MVIFTEEAWNNLTALKLDSQILRLLKALIGREFENKQDFLNALTGYMKSDQLERKIYRLTGRSLEKLRTYVKKLEKKQQRLKENKKRRKWVERRIFKNPKNFELTRFCLEELNDSEIPENVILLLKNFQDREFSSEKEFFAAARKQLGKEQTKQIEKYRKVLLNYTNNIGDFELTRFGFEELQNSDVPEEVISSLKKLQNYKFNSKKEFFIAVEKQIGEALIGEALTEKYQEILLNSANNVVDFKLPSFCFEELEDSNIPKSLITSLKKLQDYKFNSEEDFLVAVKRQIGEALTKKYRNILLKCSSNSGEFELTDFCFNRLQGFEVHEDTLALLKSLQGDSFYSKKEFLIVIEEHIGEEETKKHQKILIDCARNNPQRRDRSKKISDHFIDRLDPLKGSIFIELVKFQKAVEKQIGRTYAEDYKQKILGLATSTYQSLIMIEIIRLEIAKLAKEGQLDRLLLTLEKKFEKTLREIPDAPDTYGLFMTAIEDLLDDNRHSPLHISLVKGTEEIVHSEYSHICEDIARDGIALSPLDQVQNWPVKQPQESKVKERILEIVSASNDFFLLELVNCQLDNPDAPVKKIAELLHVNIQKIYQARKTLKKLLKEFDDSVSSNSEKGGHTNES